ncbi:MAG TPA: UDP-3-O-acyl-N-acetylglucosamine deacetylase [Candidatus Omnitrophota bacterium]|nr:UDP-3-O-acyl-N-acetylglucosamine deacetylase [Candidatus Omnitrophota bacterium]
MEQREKTIGSEVTLKGRGLQTGKFSSVTLRPAPAGYGITFARKDAVIPGETRLSDGLFSASAKRRTEIDLSGTKLQTVEHFMAALWALGIDNLKVEVDGPEMPAMDGSAKGFLDNIRPAGIEEQGPLRRFIRIREPLRVEDGSRGITVLPADKFSVSYSIDYPSSCIKKETFKIDLDGESFAREIAPARTFCMKREALFLFLSGLGRGATLENTLVLGKRGPFGTSMRFPNEPVRHKILDLVGDLYTIGLPILGEFVCERSGHALNARVLREIYERYVA